MEVLFFQMEILFFRRQLLYPANEDIRKKYTIDQSSGIASEATMQTFLNGKFSDALRKGGKK